MATITIDLLSRALPFDPSRIFPGRAARAVAPSPADYCGHLITAVNVQALMAARPWEMLGCANTPRANIFRNRHWRTPGLFAERYSAMEIQDLIAYWGCTHRFPIPTALIRTDPYLATFSVERKNRRAHAGARWKVILFLFIIAMREGWCDLDLLIDPFFMHFPQRATDVLWYTGIEARRDNLADPQLNHREFANLIVVFDESNEADPWRTHYRLNHADHPARRIAHLAGTFFNIAPQTAVAPAANP
ncbi:hypothetical protein PHMEG_00015250 [Phytophthora megakarya]|uniref:Uncharacterized protein n=1 Tax=Phytophthora megakarya TaxID=4795 RepID=A0A225W2U4_9STRA|nr:hypothetical protein PHMEG_00015250 [Phytophthora megakarya]